MRVSSRADYGVRALFELARCRNQGPVQSRAIASRQAIPEAYLHQVLGALNRAGLVRSTRGPLGGHTIARNPDEITILEVLAILDGPDRRTHVQPADDTSIDVVHATWDELQCRSEEYLNSITFATLLERQSATSPAVNYAI
ncbi:MAG: Rrf2 family transcriptional regulator [Chloroflexota bacterium]|nr:Rrf2 family transcriptional regulator [Chloroflexota bacterium]